MKRHALIFTLIVMALCCFGYPGTSAAQQEGTQPDGTIDANTRKQVIDTVLKRLNDSYVFPEVAKAMETSVRDRAAKGEYDQISSSRAFAETLTKDLQGISKDKHLRIRYSHEVLPERQPRAEPTAEQREQQRRNMSWMNYGFDKVERLRGNTGYIAFRGFFGPRPAQMR